MSQRPSFRRCLQLPPFHLLGGRLFLLLLQPLFLFLLPPPFSLPPLLPTLLQRYNAFVAHAVWRGHL
jgi:hypothetical protein